MRVHCPHAERCAGCPAIEEGYAVQLEHKGARVDAAFARFASLEAVARAAVVGADAIEAYRTRAKLVVAGRAVGLYAKDGDHVVVDLPGCRVLPATLGSVADALRAELATDDALRRALLAVDLRDVALAEGSVVLLTLVLDEAARFDAVRAAEALRVAIPTLAMVAVSRRARRSPQLLGRGLRVIAGAARVDERVAAPGGRVVDVPAVPGGFVQAHRAQAARLRAHLVEEAGVPLAGARVIDAYAGAGALGLGLAAAGARVIAIESHAPSIERAVEAARRQGLDFEGRVGDAAQVLTELAAASPPPRPSPAGGPKRADADAAAAAEADAEAEAAAAAAAAESPAPDLIVLNPPRRGVAPAVRRAVAALAPTRVAYVSCAPDTLARDLDHLARLGWRAARVTPFDMIPLSREVETLAILSPAPPTPLDVAHRADDAVVVIKSAHEPTTPHPDQPTSLLARVRAELDGFAEATAVHRLDEGTSGLVIVARTPGYVAAWSAALAEGKKTYLALVRGVTRQKGVIRRPLSIDGATAPAITRYRRLAVAGGHSLLRVVPETGRTHQIRRHLASLGHPVLGDARYGHAPSNRHFEERHALDRTFLHCARLELAGLDLEAPLSGELRLVLDRLGLAWRRSPSASSG